MTQVARKLRVANGYKLECDQLARVLHYMLDHASAKKIGREQLVNDTGLAARHVGAIVSMGAAIGFIQTGTQILTDIGHLVAEHDVFLTQKGTLEWSHYAGASTPKNLVWYEVFNGLLPHEAPMAQNQWVDRLRNSLLGDYSKSALDKSLAKEVHFVVDCYQNQNLKMLGLLDQTSDEKLYHRRYSGFEPPILAAMVYDYAERNQTHLVQMSDLSEQPASPGFVFGVEENGFRQELEALHGRGWVRYETTHGLDQLRLKADLTPDCFLRAFYEDSEPAPAGQTETKEGLF